MSTSDKYVNITQNKILGYSDFQTRLLSYLKKETNDALAQVWDGPVVHDVALTMAGNGANKFQINGSSRASDGLGNFIDIANATVKSSINFQNTNGVTYHVAMTYTVVPEEIDVNPRTGNPDYRSFKEEVGISNLPDSVADNGDGTITFIVDSVTEASVTNAGRQVLVYKIVPDKGASTVAIAMETCTVAWDGSNNKITTVASLGQTTISTDSNDYIVVLLGPVVKRYTDLSNTVGYVYVGSITGNGGTPATFNYANQQLAAISLSQLSHIAAKASNDRLKLKIVPLSNETNILQAEIDDINGIQTFTVDELGNARFAGIPAFDNKLKINSTSICVPNTSFTTPAATTARCIASHVVNGKRKISIFNRDTQYAELWDVDTMTRDSTASVSAVLPGASYKCYSTYGEGKYLYGWFYNGTTGLYIQAFDVSTWSVKSGWAATGVSMGTQTAGSNPNYLGKMIISIDQTRLCIGRWIDGQQLAYISKSNGSILSTGDGDATLTDYEPRALCTDGKYVYAVFIEGDPGATSYLVSASIANIDVGCGGTGWPKNIGAASDTWPASIACAQDRVACVTENGTYVTLYGKNGNDYQIEFNGSLLSFGQLFSDGINIYAEGYIKLHATASTKQAIFKLSIGGFLSESWGTSIKTVSMYSDEFKFLKYYIWDDIANYGTFGIVDGMDFDGNDLWKLCDPSSNFPGKVIRIPNVLIGENFSILPNYPRSGNALTPSSSSISLDFKNSNTLFVHVNQNITSITYASVPRGINKLILQYQGSYSVTGFPAGYFPASPRPPIAGTSGQYYVITMTNHGGIIMCEAVGPLTTV